MKHLTALAALTLIALAWVTPSRAKELPGWTTDLNQAFATAKKEGKNVLVDFTASDVCPACIMMRKEVFSKKEFIAAVSKKFILVEIDFPQGDPELRKKNMPLADQHKVEGFPTVLLFNSAGKEFHRFSAEQYPTTDDFLKHLAGALENKDLD